MDGSHAGRGWLKSHTGALSYLRFLGLYREPVTVAKMPWTPGTEFVVLLLMSELWAAGPVWRWVTNVTSTISAVSLLQGA